MGGEREKRREEKKGGGRESKRLTLCVVYTKSHLEVTFIISLMQ